MNAGLTQLGNGKVTDAYWCNFSLVGRDRSQILKLVRKSIIVNNSRSLYLVVDMNK